MIYYIGMAIIFVFGLIAGVWIARCKYFNRNKGDIAEAIEFLRENGFNIYAPGYKK